MQPPPSARRALLVRMLVLDVDGVLTEGGIVYGTGGLEIKCFHVRDGSGLKLWQLAGKRCAVITGRSSPVVDVRVAELAVDFVFQGASDKLPAYRRLLEEAAVEPSAVGYVGDDVPDLPPSAELRPGGGRRRRQPRGAGRGPLRHPLRRGRGAVCEVGRIDRCAVRGRWGRWPSGCVRFLSALLLAAACGSSQAAHAGRRRGGQREGRPTHVDTEAIVLLALGFFVFFSSYLLYAECLGGVEACRRCPLRTSARPGGPLPSGPKPPTASNWKTSSVRRSARTAQISTGPLS